MKIALLPPARQELDEAFAWYETQVVGLGHGFLQEFNSAARLISSFPMLYQQLAPGLRRCLLNRFPYGLIYGVNGDTIVIVAVAHLRQRPNYWQGRTQGA